MRPRILTICATITLLGLAFVMTAGSAFALPAYATATGQACTVCHTTASGGPLTATGTRFAAIPTHAANPAAAWQQVSAPAAAPAPAAPAPAAPAPAAPAPAAPAAGAPPQLPSTGDAGAASQLPMALSFLSAAFAGLGLSLRRRR